MLPLEMRSYDVPRPNQEQERDTLRTILDQIEAGELVIKQGAEEVVADIHNRLVRLDGPGEQGATA